MNCVTPTFWYAYDALGRIVSLAHDLGGVSFDRAYSYDAMDRLAADGGTAYSYDAAGNRMTRTEDGETVTYALGQGDRLASWTGGSYQYDEAGCVTRISRGADTWDLAWNGQYQLVEVSTNGAFAEAYAYDALGRRVTTRNAEGTERHVYDDNWQVVADLDEDGKVIRSYVWGEGIDQLLAVKIGSKTYTALTDVQGTVWGYADEAGDVVARWTYDAWGNALSEEVAEGAAELRVVRYRFQGREWSEATGLTNFRMRWYDAITGRWLSKDPIGLSGGLNQYAFCKGDSLDYRDAFGEAVLATRGLGHTWKITKYTPGIILPVIGPAITEIGNWGVYHQHIFYEDEKGGNVGYSKKGCFTEMSDDGYDRSPWHYDDATIRKAVDELLKSGDWDPEDYDLIKHNCQDFCDAIIKKYGELNGPKRKWRW